MSDEHNRNAPRTRPAWAALLVAALAASLGGCYDGEQLVLDARNEAIHTRLEEVDLGTYQTTMPRDPETAIVTEMEFSVFATAPRYRIPKIKARLQEESYRIRYAVLTAVRQASPEDLAEPEFSDLRERLFAVTNEILKDTPVETIGFSKVRLMNM